MRFSELMSVNSEVRTIESPLRSWAQGKRRGLRHAPKTCTYLGRGNACAITYLYSVQNKKLVRACHSWAGR